MSKINFEIRRKITDKKVASVEANNFKAAIQEFAETYDMPVTTISKNLLNNDKDVFIAVHDTTKIEFKCYCSKDQNYIEYKWKNTVGKISLNKKGDKTWVGYFET